MKTILLVRVSTLHQSYQEQRNILINYAISKGYDTQHQYVIEDKESAIKLNEEERNGINQMKHLINTDKDINSVIVHDITRLARTEKVLHSVKDFLIESKINLHIYDKGYSLFNNDMTLNEDALLLFSLYSYFAAQEMKIKKRRFAYGKEEGRKKGKYTTGRLLFGYTSDNDNNIIIDESKTDIIRYIFDKYITSDISLTQLGSELQERGYIPQSYKKRYLHMWVKRIVTDYSYCGLNSKGKHPHIYPPIVTKEDVDNATSKLNQNKNHIRISKYIYYAKGLLKSLDNTTLIGDAHKVVYHNPNNKNETYNINTIDSILWYYCSNVIYPSLLTDGLNNNSKELKQQININNEKIKTNLTLINNSEQEKERLNELYIIGRINDKTYQQRYENINNKQANLRRFNEELNENSISLQKRLESVLKRTGIVLNDIWSIKDDKERQRIIKECIFKVIVYKSDGYSVMDIYSNLTRDISVTFKFKYNTIIFKNKKIVKKIIERRFIRKKRG